MEVLWTTAAKQDLAKITRYFQENAPEQTALVVENLFENAENLGFFPLAWPVGKVSGTRERYLDRYSYKIVYRIKAECVEILRVCHYRQKWP